MKNWKLQNRILSLVLLPGLIVSLFLGGFFVIQRMSDLDNLLQERGLAIGKQAASTSEYGVVSGNNESLQNLTNNLLEERDLRSARVINKDGQVLAHSGPKMITNYIGNTQLKNNQLQLAKTNKSIHIKAPIFAQNIDIIETSLEPQYKQQQISHDLLGWVEIEMSIANTQVAKYQNLGASLLMVLITFILSLVLAIRLSRNISEPIKEMVTCVDKISDGKTESRVHINSGDEFQALASGINAMAIAIQRTKYEHSQNVEQATHELRETLDMIEIQNIELDIARKEAVEGSRIKSDFLANISHEIRTPLNGILGFTRILLKDQTDPRKTEHLKTIKKSANGLLTIINDILDLSKIDAGKLVLENIDFNVREILEDVLTISAPDAQNKSLELVSLVYTDVPPYLVGDPLRIKQILTNLISNAIKFTPQGNITVRVMILEEDLNQASIKFEITDTGIGLNSVQQKKLFNAFNQADTSTTRKYGGTGLGLAISQHLVKAMKGDISITSAEGEGSTFYFSVNLKKSRQQPEEMLDLKNHQVLIMESASSMRLSLTHLMEQWQIRYSDTDNGDILLQSLFHKQQNDDPVDAVVLGLSRKELYLPNTASLIKQINSFLVPVIVMVNSAIAEELEYAQKLGAFQSLYKPIQSRKLYSSLCASVGKDLEAESFYNSARSVPAPTILAVDDNEANLKLLTVLLEDMGITVVQADSGPQALLKIEELDIDMVFMDIQMPGMNGLEATQLIRLNKSATELPIIALTAHAIADEKDEIMKAGMNDYQTKPINNNLLMQSIERWTGYHCEEDYDNEAYLTKSLLPAPQQRLQETTCLTQAAIKDGYLEKKLESNFTDAIKGEPRESQKENQKANQSANLAANKNIVPQISLEEDCLIFDAAYAMRLANNKLDLAIDMFTMLLNNLDEDLQSIESMWKSQQQEPLLQQIHKIHGATRYCGIPCLMNTLERLETALKHSELYETEELYTKTLMSIRGLQNWAQKNNWKEKLQEVANRLY